MVKNRTTYFLLFEKIYRKIYRRKTTFSKYDDETILLKEGVLTKIENKIFPTIEGIMVFGEYLELYPNGI